MNVVVLIGRMVADPELKYTPSGIANCTFRIAVNREYKSASGEREADFIDIVAWRQRAEFVANYMAKGRLVAVQGSLQVRSWVQQDGQKRYKTEVIADNVQGLDRPKESGGFQNGGGAMDNNIPPDIADPGADDADYDPFASEA